MLCSKETDQLTQYVSRVRSFESRIDGGALCAIITFQFQVGQ